MQALRTQLEAAQKAALDAESRVREAEKQAGEYYALNESEAAENRALRARVAELETHIAAARDQGQRYITALLSRLRFLRNSGTLVVEYALRSPDLLARLRTLDRGQQPPGTHKIDTVRGWWTCHFKDGTSECGRLYYEISSLADQVEVLVAIGADDSTKSQNIEWLRQHGARRNMPRAI